MQEALQTDPEPSANQNLFRELNSLAARYRSDFQNSPFKKELDRLKKAPGIKTAVMGELVEGVQTRDYRRTWDAIQWFGRLGIKIPDKQLQQDLPQLAKECEDAMDAQGIKYKPKPKGIKRRAVLIGAGGLGITVAAGGVAKAAQAVLAYGRNTAELPRPVYTPTSTEQPTAKSAATPEPTATAEPKSEEKIGNLNLVEYLFGDLLNRYKARRIERFHFEGGFKERVHNEFLNSDQMTFLLLGTDEMRERAGYFSGIGGGRSDVIEIVSFNPHNFKILRMAIPRDMLAPELGRFIRDPKFSALFDDGGPRITNMTQTARVAGFDSMSLVRQIIESALGVPIDQIVKFNIDATQGYQEGNTFHLGFFDAVIPEGLEINVQAPVISADSGKVVVGAGRQVLNGKLLTDFVRIRPKSGGGDFERTQRREQVIKAVILHLAKNMLGEYIFKGDVTKLNKLIDFIQAEKNNGDIFDYERDITKDITIARDIILKLRESVQGNAALIALVANTTDNVKNLVRNPQHIVSYNFNRDNLVANVQAGEANTFGNLYLLKPINSRTDSAPASGGYLNYWAAFRDKAKQLIAQL